MLLLERAPRFAGSRLAFSDLFPLRGSRFLRVLGGDGGEEKEIGGVPSFGRLP